MVISGDRIITLVEGLVRTSDSSDDDDEPATERRPLET